MFISCKPPNICFLTGDNYPDTGGEIDIQLKEELLSIISKSSFSPKIWVSNLSESSFSLSFSEYIEE
jgi:hypothetical protein